MMTVRTLISQWPKPAMTEFARDLGVNWMQAHQWRLRNNIPAEYWPTLVSAAKRRGVKGITLAALAEAYAQRARKSKPAADRQTARVG